MLLYSHKACTVVNLTFSHFIIHCRFTIFHLIDCQTTIKVSKYSCCISIFLNKITHAYGTSPYKHRPRRLFFISNRPTWTYLYFYLLLSFFSFFSVNKCEFRCCCFSMASNKTCFSSFKRQQQQQHPQSQKKSIIKYNNIIVYKYMSIYMDTYPIICVPVNVCVRARYRDTKQNKFRYDKILSKKDVPNLYIIIIIILYIKLACFYIFISTWCSDISVEHILAHSCVIRPSDSWATENIRMRWLNGFAIHMYACSMLVFFFILHHRQSERKVHLGSFIQCFVFLRDSELWTHVRGYVVVHIIQLVPQNDKRFICVMYNMCSVGWWMNLHLDDDSSIMGTDDTSRCDQWLLLLLLLTFIQKFIHYALDVFMACVTVLFSPVVALFRVFSISKRRY